MVVNGFGVIPKKSKLGTWRLITDLSYPPDNSVNSGIPKDLCPLQHTMVDAAVKLIVKSGQGSLMAKLDIQNAYRNMPVHPDDRHLHGSISR